MTIEFNLKVDHLNRALAAVRKGLEQPEVLMKKVGISLLQVNRDRHSAGLAPDGSKWKSLSPLTIGSAIFKAQGGAFTKSDKVRKAMSLAVARKVQAKKTNILRESGNMLDSFRCHPSGDTVTLGFDGGRDSDLAAWHHSGTKPYVITPKNKKALAFAGIVTKRVNHPGLPSRKLVGFPDSDRQLTHHVVEDYLTTILKSVR